MIPDYMPSPHPLLVHFPIVLLIAAALLDLAAVVIRSRRLRDLTTWVLVAGTLSLPVTYWTGTMASDRVSSPFPETVGAMSEHADLAWITLWFFVVLTGARLLFRWLGDVEGWRHALFVLGTLFGAGLLATTADHGGRLVYDLGAGVRPVREAPQGAFEPEPEVDPAELGPVVSEETGLTWRFQPGVEGALDRFLVAMRGEIPPARTESRRTALVLEPEPGSGPRLLTLRQALGDASVQVTVDPSGLEGRFGLLLHAADADDLEFLTLEGGELRLGVRRGGTDRVLDREPLVPAGWSELELVAAGEHLRGYVDGELVVHGHADPAADGPAGLIVEGTGMVRLEMIRVRPVDE